MARLTETGVSGGERSDGVEHCLAGIARLSNEVKESSSRIPAYDLRTYDEVGWFDWSAQYLLTGNRQSKPSRRNFKRHALHLAHGPSLHSNPPCADVPHCPVLQKREVDPSRGWKSYMGKSLHLPRWKIFLSTTKNPRWMENMDMVRITAIILPTNNPSSLEKESNPISQGEVKVF